MAFPLSLNIQNSNHIPNAIQPPPPPPFEPRVRPKGRASQTPATHNAEGNQTQVGCVLSA